MTSRCQISSPPLPSFPNRCWGSTLHARDAEILKLEQILLQELSVLVQVHRNAWTSRLFWESSNLCNNPKILNSENVNICKCCCMKYLPERFNVMFLVKWRVPLPRSSSNAFSMSWTKESLQLQWSHGADNSRMRCVKNINAANHPIWIKSHFQIFTFRGA